VPPRVAEGRGAPRAAGPRQAHVGQGAPPLGRAAPRFGCRPAGLAAGRGPV